MLPDRSTTSSRSGPDRGGNRSNGRGRRIDRRQSLRLLGGSIGSVALGACASTASDATAELAFTRRDFAGASLTSIMRRSFIPEVNELTESFGHLWSRRSNATITLSFGDDWRQRIAAVAEARAGEDLVELHANGAHLYRERLVDVTDLAEEIGATSGGWMPAARDAVMVDGRWLAIPWAYTAHSINYREQYLREVGAESLRTYDDLLEAATRLRDAGLPLAGFSMSETAPNNSANLAYSLLWSFGGHEADESGKKVALNSAATRSALTFYRELVAVSDERALHYDEGGNNKAFLDDETAMTQNASSIYWKALRDEPAIANDMNHQRYPSGPSGHHQLVEMNALAIFEHCRNQEAAIDWLRFATKPERLRSRADISLSFFSPPLTDFLDDPAMPWNSTPRLEGMKGVGRAGHMPGWPGPSNEEAGLVYENGSIIRMFRSVGTGSESIESAVKLATEELRRVYGT